MATRWIAPTVRQARRAGVALIGGSVVLFGLALLVLPGPAFVVIPIGLAILGLEFAWARRWLERAREQAAATLGSARGDDPAAKPCDD